MPKTPRTAKLQPGEPASEATPPAAERKPMRLDEIRQLARARMPSAIEAWADIAKSGGAALTLRNSAANRLKEIGMGNAAGGAKREAGRAAAREKKDLSQASRPDPEA